MEISLLGRRTFFIYDQAFENSTEVVSPDTLGCGFATWTEHFATRPQRSQKDGYVSIANIVSVI
jgi:hypothetical protein